MNKLILLSFCSFNCLFCFGQFDQHLADSLGADEYGMKTYVMAFLKTGPNRTEEPEASAKLMRAHLDNIIRLEKEGKLILAGPFYQDTENSDLRGIYIFDVDDLEEARQLTATDPAIQSGHLIMELKKWYGTAALLMLSTYYEKISKKKI